MEFRILGPLDVWRDGHPLPLGGEKQRGVLALLLLHRVEVVSSERLIDELWGERPPATAAKSIHVYVSRLRRALGDGLLETHGHGYRLAVQPGQLDATRFEALLGDGRAAAARGEPAAAADVLHEALGLWRGPPLADLAYVPFAQLEIARLTELRLAAQEELVDAELRLGRHAEVVAELESLVAEHPLRERPLGQLMLALYRCGRQAEALERYRSGRNAQVQELGLEPSPALRHLEQAILEQSPELDPPPPEVPAMRHDGVGGGVPRTSNPYKGLRPFGEEDAADFFGREALVEELVARVGAGRFLGVVGPSGSGKSSVVRAGLIPRLRSGALPGSQRWHIAEMFPGAHPLEELEARLLGLCADPPAGVMRELAGGPDGLSRALERVLPGDDAELLLVIDQLEELFTLVADEGRRAHFLQIVSEAVGAPGSRVRVVCTLRADFYDRPLLHRGFGDLLSDNTEALVPLSPDELERAIAGPARGAGVTIEDGLVAEMVADVVDEPGSLPLLQYALTELYERREARMLTRAAYEEIGGTAGALAGRAEALFAQLGSTGAHATKQLFLRLVSVGEGTDDTRRRVPRPELETLDVDQQALRAAIDFFAASRLLSLDRDPRTGAPTVEVAHEALLREWERLRGWIAEAREDLLVQHRLSAGATEWDASGRDASFLPRGGRLDQFEARAATSGIAPTALEREFLAAGIRQRDAERVAEEERLAREAALERRSVHRLRALVGVLAVAAIVAAVLTVVAFHQSHRSRHQARVAAARELAAASLANLDVDPERSILLGLQAVKRYTDLGGQVPRDAVEALHRAVESSRVRLTFPGSGSDVAFSSDGRVVATAGNSAPLTVRGMPHGRAILWDSRTGRRIHAFPLLGEQIGDIQLSPDGRRMATIVGGRETVLWDVATGRRLLTLHGPPPLVLAYSHDSRSVAATSFDGSLVIWDAHTGHRRLLVKAPYSLCGDDFSPDDRNIVTAGCNAGEQATIWDTRNGHRVRNIAAGHGPMIDAAYSPDGRRVATAGIDGKARVWDARTGRLVSTMLGHTGWVYSVSFSPDGRRLATGSSDNTARVWDTASGRQVLVLAGSPTVVFDALFSPDGKRLLTGGGRTPAPARIWDVSPGGGRDALTLAVHGGLAGAQAVEYSPDGSRLATGGYAPSARLLDATTGRQRWVRHDGVNGMSQTRFSPDGKRLLLAGDGVPVVVDAANGRVLARLNRPVAVPFSPGAAWSADSRLVAIGSFDGTATVWDAATGRLQRVLRHSKDGNGGGAVGGVAFSPDGKRLATVDWDHTVKLWDLGSGRRLLTLPADSDQVNSVTFDRAGRRMLTGSSDGLAKLWTVPSGHLIETLDPHAGAVWDAEFSPDEKTIATATDDTAARLWDTASGRELLRLSGSAFAVYHLAFSPDGHRLATASGDGTVRVYLLRLGDLVRLAAGRVTRGLTAGECRQYLHVAACPRARSA